MFARFRSRCCQCIRKIRLPQWFTKPLMWTYTRLGGVVTYALFIGVVYTTLLSLQQDIALLPECRAFLEPVPLKGGSAGTNSSNVATTSVTPQSSFPTNLIATTVSTSATTHQMQPALECRRGEALSVLIYYTFGFLCGELMELMHLPGLLGMLVGGLALRNIKNLIISENIYHLDNRPVNSTMPFGVDPDLVNWSEDLYPFNITDAKTQLAALLIVSPSLSAILRQLALTTILTRAGLGIDPNTLKAMCGSVLRLAVLPCLTESAALMIFSHIFIGWPWAWGAVLGFVCAAVSPAVIVPNMMRLEITGWGVAEGIPTLVVAASSLDDVVSITGFGVALSVALATGKSLLETLLLGPAEVLLGATYGVLIGSLVCLFPPPKLEHSHLLRGLLLICLAITGLIGSVSLNVAGAGALACLTLSFVVASGWRAGLPWRLTQPAVNIDADAVDQHLVPDTSSNYLEPCKTVLSDDDDDDRSTPRPTVTNAINMKSLKGSDFIKRKGTDSSKQRSGKRQRQVESSSSSTLETLVEYHPYYCSILRQQYNHQPEQGKFSSLRLRTGGDLPSVAVAVAASRGERQVDAKTGSISKIDQPQPTQLNPSRTKPRSSRRFSLPEPTAHYEMESFYLPDAFRPGLSLRSSTSGSRSRSRDALNRSRNRLMTPTFREQYAAMYNQPVSKLEEEEEEEHDLQDKDRHKPSLDIARPASGGSPIPPNTNQSGQQQPDLVSGSSAAVIPVVTPKERGLVCLNSMRQTLAAIWWFVQPILFSLIGSEVNLQNMKGNSTGLGVVALLIALVFRIGATIVSVLPSKLNMRERLFIAFSWLPKATVQAAIGPVALDTARRSNASPEIIGWGEQVLALAAISILLTAPLGALLMPLTAPYLLHQDLSATQVLVDRTPTSTRQSALQGERESSRIAAGALSENEVMKEVVEPVEEEEQNGEITDERK